MKAKIYLYFLLLTGILFISCKKSNLVYQNDFNKSYQSWMNFKSSSGNSYRFALGTYSWVGSSSQTIITVKDGKVVQRAYTAKMRANDTSNQIRVYEEWMEDESKLGSHSTGLAFRTLDDIYQEAKDQWLLKRDNADIFFETKNNGMISSCGYIEKGCQDDCFRGIHIDFIEKIQ
jgi:major membrane immunogen (membrane-anchored lipoprotein)